MLTSQPPSDGIGRAVQQGVKSGATPLFQDSRGLGWEGHCSNQTPDLRCFPPGLSTCLAFQGDPTLELPGGDNLKHTETRSFYKKRGLLTGRLERGS